MLRLRGLSCWIAAVALCGCGGDAGPLEADRSVLLITLDTTRADHLSCLGGDPRTTPNIDSLAERGWLFTHALSETNVTNPSHVSILTGLRAVRHGVINNVTALAPDVPLFPELLREAGYQTAGFAAVRHLSNIPAWRGFDRIPPVLGTINAQQVTHRAMTWHAQRDATRPYFLWVHYFDPHTPYSPPDDDAAKYYEGDPLAGDGPPIASDEYFRKNTDRSIGKWLGKVRDPAWPRAMYAAEIHSVDREVGRLLEAVRDDDPVIVLTADHGESLDEHELYYDHKGLFEQQLHIPLVIRAPSLGAGRSDLLASTIDVVPTLAELLGVELPEAPSGISLVSVLEGTPSKAIHERTSFVHQHAHNHAAAIRVNDWKLIWPIAKKHPVIPLEPMLFDLGRDPDELDNLYEREGERAELMRQALEPWIDLARVRPGIQVELSEEQRAELEALGYL